MGRTYSKVIADEIEKYLTKTRRPHSFDRDCGMFRFRKQLPDPMKKGEHNIRVSDHGFALYVTLPFSAPVWDETKLLLLQGLFHRINFRLDLAEADAYFLLDGIDGEIRLVVPRYCGTAAPTPAAIQSAIETANDVLGLVGKAIYACVFHDEISRAGRNRERWRDKFPLFDNGKTSNDKMEEGSAEISAIMAKIQAERAKHHREMLGLLDPDDGQREDISSTDMNIDDESKEVPGMDTDDKPKEGSGAGTDNRRKEKPESKNAWSFFALFEEEDAKKAGEGGADDEGE